MKPSSPPTAPFPTGPGRVLRLTVEFRESTWSVVSKQVVDDMTVTASQPAPEPGRTGRITGLWFEVLDRKGRLLYRSAQAEPVPGVEVHHRDGTIRRAQTELKGWSTDLLVPILQKGTRLRLHHVPGTGAPVEVKQQDAATGLVLDLGIDDVIREG